MDDRPSWLALSVEGKVLETLKKHGGIGKVRIRSNRMKDKERNIAADPQEFAFIRYAKRRLTWKTGMRSR